MNKAELEAFAKEAAKTIKTEKDLNAFNQMLTKITVEAALNAELDEHLGYGKYQPSDTTNSRNGFSSKTLRTEDGQFDVAIPRDRDSSFEPQLVSKHQTRFTSLDDKILSLYAKGMSTREIVAAFKELYGACRGIGNPDFKGNRCCYYPGGRMAIPPAGCRLSDPLPGLYRGENPPGQAGDQQGHLSRSRGEHGRPQRAVGLMAVGK